MDKEAKGKMIEKILREAIGSIIRLMDDVESEDDKEYCPNAPLKPGEMCFCGKPVRPGGKDGGE